MPRLKLPDYPRDDDDPWHLVTTRAPKWVLDVIQGHAKREHTETWVPLADWLRRAGRLPVPPPLPPAVCRRYPGMYTSTGLWVGEAGSTAEQLELGAVHPEDVEAEADEAAGRTPRRTSRPRERETAAGGIAAVVRRVEQRQKGTRR